jgi:HD-GYP domain-containing protein (c-di-GMP phosphodiesterase class II)
VHKKVLVENLELGMYVDKLDRPWLETTFPLKGVMLHTPEDIEAVRKVCKYVYIDPEKGRDVTPPRDQLHFATGKKPATTKRKAPVLRVVDYDAKERVPFQEELPHAKEFHQRARSLIDSLHSDIRAGRSINAEGAKVVVSGMVDSIMRNPDALLWLAELKSVDEYTAIHSLNVCILSLAFGRHMGLAPEDLHELGLAALHDLGKVKVPQEVLQKPDRLTAEEFDVMKQHPVHGLDILQQCEGLSPEVLEVAYSHHERSQGQGYPRGLTLAEMNLFSRMVAIVDFYDALTSDRVYRAGLSSAEVNRLLYEGRGREFDPALVEEFISCLGIFPVGSVVELDSGEVGIVISANPKRRLKPTVMLVLNADKRRYQPLRMANLWQLDVHQVSKEIKRVLEPGTHGIYARDFVNEVASAF